MKLRIPQTARGPRAALAACAFAFLSAGSAPADPTGPASISPEMSLQATATAAASPATHQVEKLHTALIGIMQGAQKLGYAGRYEAVISAVTTTFDIPFMASKSVGRHWKSLGDEDKARWNDVFMQVVAANYAGRFNAFSGERFETLGEEPATNDTRVVLTRLIIPNDDDVHLNYRLREVDGEWKIIDIYLNGTVSELALRRSEYSAVLQREGFKKLLDTLDDKVKELAKS